MKNKKTLKPFYKLRDVEYSTDFNFFLENQIFITYTIDDHAIFTSALESLEFLDIEITTTPDIFSKYSTIPNCENIHKDLLKGRYGTGEFID